MCRDCGCSTSTHPLFLKEQNAKNVVGKLTLKRTIEVEESIFQKNQSLALKNREQFAQRNMSVINVMSSPGSGKTTLLSKLLSSLKDEVRLSVLVGDQETTIDQDRYLNAGVDAKQINTRSACHLNASQIEESLKTLPPDLEMLVIENVGNLVCPAVFDLGEEIKIAVLSTPEGEEKPLKYPVLFHDADIIVITKIDLINVLDYNLLEAVQNIRTLNTKAPVFLVSTKTGEGLDDLKNDILSRRNKRSGHVLSNSGHS